MVLKYLLAKFQQQCWRKKYLPTVLLPWYFFACILLIIQFVKLWNNFFKNCFDFFLSIFSISVYNKSYASEVLSDSKMTFLRKMRECCHMSISRVLFIYNLYIKLPENFLDWPIYARGMWLNEVEFSTYFLLQSTLSFYHCCTTWISLVKKVMTSRYVIWTF